MIDTDCLAPKFHAAFDLIPTVGMQRSHAGSARYDSIEPIAFQPVEWVKVRVFEWHRAADDDGSFRAEVRPVILRKIDEPALPRYQYRIGSLADEVSVPDDFDTMFQAEIEDIFGL